MMSLFVTLNISAHDHCHDTVSDDTAVKKNQAEKVSPGGSLGVRARGR